MSTPKPSHPKTILITGASRGIGLAIARFLLTEGHNVFLVARTREPLERLKMEFEGKIEYLTGDVAEKDFELGLKAVSATIETFKRLDGLILNHGTLHPLSRIVNTTASEWSAALTTNLTSLISFIQPAIPHLRTSKGKIILTSSGAAASAYASWGAYGASKAALNHLAMTLGVEEKEIVSVALRPGAVDTDMQTFIRQSRDVMDVKDAQKYSSLHADGKLLRPEQPGNVMARLVLDAGAELSGKFLSWDAKELAAFQDR